MNDENSDIAFKNTYGYGTLRDYLKAVQKSSKLKIGDSVRIQHKSGPFEKGYYPLWTDTVYSVRKDIIQSIENHTFSFHYQIEI